MPMRWKRRSAGRPRFRAAARCLGGRSDGQFTEDFRQARPEAANLLTIFAALTNRDLAEVVTDFEGKGFADFKQAMTEVAVERPRARWAAR